jgi:peptidoglycan biosynthesis protein MviN/MurJ (putative lipid II flippase)
MAVGEQKIIVLSPLIEGVTNVIFSVFLTSKIGVVGVALGTFIGGSTGVLLHLFYNLQRTKSILVENVTVVLSAICKPLISVIPGAIYFLFFVNRETAKPSFFEMFLFCMVMLMTIYMLFLFAITKSEKDKIKSLLRQRLKRLLFRSL